MIAMAVVPIDNPISSRRSHIDEIAWCTGERGNSYRAPKMQAEIMKAPSRPASITYSGQCRRSESIAPSLGAACESVPVTASFGVSIVRMFSVPFISMGGLIRNGCKSDNTAWQSSYIRAVPRSIESRRGPSKAAFVTIGIFLFFGMSMPFLAGTTLLSPGTALDRIWVRNRRAHFQLAPLGPRVGLAFLLLAMTLAAAGVGWF